MLNRPTVTAHRWQPGPGCPARVGDGVDVRHAQFVLIVDDASRRRDRRPAITDIWGYFRRTPADTENHIVTDGLEVPLGSPISRLAHRVGRRSRRVRKVGAILRKNVLSCPCTPAARCPALDELRLLAAMEKSLARNAPAIAHRALCALRRARHQLPGM